jgi:hypothetical protein
LPINDEVKGKLCSGNNTPTQYETFYLLFSLLKPENYSTKSICILFCRGKKLGPSSRRKSTSILSEKEIPGM